MKRVVKFLFDSSLELEELDSPPLVHSRMAIVASCLGLLSLTTFFLEHVWFDDRWMVASLSDE
jgi:hypothetical protein